jgi:hypothetical protein
MTRSRLSQDTISEAEWFDMFAWWDYRSNPWHLSSGAHVQSTMFKTPPTCRLSCASLPFALEFPCQPHRRIWVAEDDISYGPAPKFVIFGPRASLSGCAFGSCRCRKAAMPPDTGAGAAACMELGLLARTESSVPGCVFDICCGARGPNISAEGEGRSGP